MLNKIAVVVLSPSRVHLFATPWTAAHQVSLSLIISQSLPKFMFIVPATSSSDALFSFCSKSFPASGAFPMSQLFTSDDKNTGASASATVLSMNIQGWFPLRLTLETTDDLYHHQHIFKNTDSLMGMKMI